MAKPKKEPQETDVNGIKMCLLQLGKETEECGLHFSALMIRAAALSLEEKAAEQRP